MLTPDQIDLVRATAIRFDPDRFYETLFHMAPAFRGMFRKDAAIQHAALQVALEGVIQHLDTFDAIRPQLRALGHRHTTLYGVSPKMYDVVGRALLATLELERLGRLHEEAQGAWTALYGMIAEEMRAGVPPETE